MSTPGQRLKEERNRLGYSQEAFGEIGGVKRRAQANYEADEREPGARYLARLMDVGMDAIYVLSGRRPDDPWPAQLSQEEMELIDIYRALPPATRHQAQGYMTALLHRDTKQGRSSIRWSKKKMSTKGD